MTGLLAAFDIDDEDDTADMPEEGLTPDPIMPVSSILPDDGVSM
ncbi:hypothetical protein [Tateyamaria sp. SN3-11]